MVKFIIDKVTGEIKMKANKKESRDGMLAGIFYTLVHDFSDELIHNIRAQLRVDGGSQIMEQVEWIRDWAKKNDFFIVEERANMVVEAVETVSIHEVENK